ncbi:hypothetical protein ACVR1G_10295 [Streptococcus dentasini]
MLFYFIVGLILLMPVLGLVFIGLAVSPKVGNIRWVMLIGLLLFALSFYSLYLKIDVLFFSFFALGPFLFGLGLPVSLSSSKRLQAGLSGLGLLLLFLGMLLIIANMLNHI